MVPSVWCRGSLSDLSTAIVEIVSWKSSSFEIFRSLFRTLSLICWDKSGGGGGRFEMFENDVNCAHDRDKS